jgi:antitoxin HicB
MNTRPHVGSSFDDLLAQDGTLEEVTARALKRVIARQLAHEMKSQKLTKSAMALRMGTSRSQLDRLLDPDTDSMTIDTLVRAAHAVGRRVNVEFVPV